MELHCSMAIDGSSTFLIYFLSLGIFLGGLCLFLNFLVYLFAVKILPSVSLSIAFTLSAKSVSSNIQASFGGRSQGVGVSDWCKQVWRIGALSHQGLLRQLLLAVGFELPFLRCYLFWGLCCKFRVPHPLHTADPPKGNIALRPQVKMTMFCLLLLVWQELALYTG